MAAERHGLKLRVAPINDRGELILDSLFALINERTKLIAVAHASNVLGTINPIRRIIECAHELGVKVLVDGAQAVPHTAVDVTALDADFYAFSGHKVYGPNGIGALYGKAELLDAMPPYQGGGEMIATVTFEKTTYNELPYKYEAGTPDYVGSVALAEALRYVSEIGLETIAAHEHALMRYAVDEMLRLPGMRLIGTAEEKSAVISFLVGNIHPFDLGTLLDHQGIAVRTGHHCAQPLIDSLGIPGTARASFAMYNTAEEVDAFIAALRKAVAILQ
jgi:cysteine desulfurase/selenocysteine lyase